MKTDSLFAVLALLAGCSSLPMVGPDYTKPEIDVTAYPMPDAGSVAEKDDRKTITVEELKLWWSSFDDKTLDGLVGAAVSNNVSYKVAAERLVASRWELFGANAAFMPKVSFGASAMETEKGPNTASGQLTTIHRDVFSGGFDASWEIDIFGGNRRAKEAAKASYEASMLDVSDAWVSLTAEVARQYIELRTTQQRLEVARRNLSLQSQTYDIVKSRLDSGIGDELSVSQSKYIVEQTRAAIPPLMAQEEKLKNSIAVLVGKMPGACHEMLKDLPPAREWVLPASRIADAPVDAIRMRPDVRAAERRLAAQTHRIGVAKSLWYPKLFINGTLGLESLKADKFLRRDSLYGSIGPSVSWPIFQGGSIYANVKVEESRTRQVCLEYESALQKAYGEVRDAYAVYTHEFHRYEALKAAVQAARDAVTISNDLNKNGLKDFTAVIDAQRSLLTLEEALVVSRGNITAGIILLYKSLAGGL